MAGHELLGVILAGLQLGAQFAGAEDGNAGLAQAVGDAGGQGPFRAHHDQADLLRFAGRDHGAMVVHVQRQPLAEGRHAIAARRQEEGPQERALLQLPSQGVLAAAAADQQDVEHA